MFRHMTREDSSERARGPPAHPADFDEACSGGSTASMAHVVRVGRHLDMDPPLAG